MSQRWNKQTLQIGGGGGWSADKIIAELEKENKYVRWQSTDLSTTNSEYWFIAVTEVTFNVLFATSSSNRPIFWFMVEIKN